MKLTYQYLDPCDFNSILCSTELRSHQCQGKTTKWTQTIINNRVLLARFSYHCTTTVMLASTSKNRYLVFFLVPDFSQTQFCWKGPWGFGESLFGNKTLHERKFESKRNAMDMAKESESHVILI